MMAIKLHKVREKARRVNVFQRAWLSFRPSRRPSVRDEKTRHALPKQRRRLPDLGSDLLANSANISLRPAIRHQTIKPYWHTYPLLTHPHEPHPRRPASWHSKKELHS